MNDGYKVPTDFARSEFVEKKSRFISQIWHVQNEQDALDKIRDVKKEFHDARHNVYAYITNNNLSVRYSDDGEPQGTAGQPILEVLKREELCDVCCVVTRYFGGILLGASGLTRAYAKAAKDAVNLCGKSVMVEYYLYRGVFSYDRLELARRTAECVGAELGNIAYEDAVTIDFLVSGQCADLLQDKITEITNGKTELILLGRQLKSKGL